MTRDLLHVVTPFGHLAPSARHEIPDENLSSLVPHLTAALSTPEDAGTVLPDGYRLKAEATEALLSFEVEKPAGDFLVVGFVYCEASSSPEFWEVLRHRQNLTLPPAVPPTPWLLIILNEEGIADDSATSWIETFTYSLAWCWLEHATCASSPPPRQGPPHTYATHPRQPRQDPAPTWIKIAGLLSGILIGLFLLKAAGCFDYF